MWQALGGWVLRNRMILLAILLVLTGFMGWQASKVKLSYEFAKAIPTDNPKYQTYQQFKQRFGEDGNMLVIGIQTDQFFTEKVFNDFRQLQQKIKAINGVEDILSVPGAVNLVKNWETEKLQAAAIFPEGTLTQAEIDSTRDVFLNLPFYQGLLYNPDSKAYLMGVRINRQLLASKARSEIVNAITKEAEAFGSKQNMEVHLSGLPLIRTVLADRISAEMKWFTFGSIALSAIILFLFFRSFSAMLLSLAVVVIGVIWSFGTLELMGYRITLLTALIAPLVVVIGIPNCIYFLNKYHTAYRSTGNREKAIVQMIAKMGVVTLFCNIAAAIGFAVFALTESAILKEFGAVAGINIMMLFFISLILIPAVLSLMQPPKEQHVRYLDNRGLQRWLDRLERWSLNHRKLIYAATAVLLVAAVMGIFRLKSVGYIVDDLPATDRLVTDLKFFETHFRGVMPLEITIDTKEKNGIRKGMLRTVNGIDSLTQFLAAKPYIGKPISFVEGLKFVKQAFFEGDSVNYSVPSEYDLPALQPYLSMKGGSDAQGASLGKLVASFMDSTRQVARISVNMQDVGSAQLPLILDSIEQRTSQLFDSSRYKVSLTGTSVTFLEGTTFIIEGLKESIFWAFLLIALCMLYLFRSGRILLCSLIPNLVPLVITAGVMGWVGVPLKPSTVLIFSVALGIAIDITIRFLVNYKQDLQAGKSPKETVVQTIHSTGLSIIYTSIVLVAGFVIFCFSGFGGTQALGWLTSLTLVVATITNLVLLPALLISFSKNKK
ncbi:efflux RND transporter permease subunit [Pseudocnuella soli]|uniref:efflux RND transporter permease subunit n=1 Tax=Pseudocnuella soli TaxID=2502779 RepID=UPI0010503D1C|nr:MMPL family transporter [Pseudocnuella soli]